MIDRDLHLDRPAPGVLRLTLNRPAARNAITLSLHRRMDEVLSEAAADDSVRAVVLAGAGQRAFSAGYDLAELGAATPAQAAAMTTEREELLWRYAAFPKPTVAAVQGAAHGAGTMLAVCSDLRVGGADTSLAVTAAKYGGVNLTWLLDSLIGGAHTRDLLLTAREVRGAEAHRIGLLHRYAIDVAGTAVDLAGLMARRPSEGLREIKALLLEGAGRSLRDRYERENAAVRANLAVQPISEMFSSFFAARSRGTGVTP
ncbi:enoyl-CoA hydratase/isomerase family protein [Nocardia jinanensis]|uniref:Enoyl-CoA hydratase n=1 Tax=Nocardia jinanensis TaxID=382504 RepID=A0A917RP08_9NOCA|nr:enoyl-CoA hydratase/isomerase family protein [Nocardia jinanensis]GGL16899.1 enoyl-CoA hydratase [Nocardia jinanensis]